ncbi:hypothetical protein [uncultured Tateyamaria sp.]|uniref:hypothetical protein n=1 Tax=uncultured Tateyamaria sp. TaxID=455651 RepID=UPI00263322F4|nr:hypothetical protein [uncultured Tateyamaria sp.]
METQETINARATRVRTALRTAFGVKAKSLDAALRRTGRRLPKRLHAEARRIVEAQALGGQPKLMRQVDGGALDRAETRILTFLGGIDRPDRRKGMWLGIAGVVAFNILLIAAGLVVWMVWTGQI